jgi:hypothetical protein
MNAKAMPNTLTPKRPLEQNTPKPEKKMALPDEACYLNTI